ncbi:ROK family protein [Hoeflea sp. TYP-13]|uniref:ROK family transcriptional regulator n=1 Tax=Hoeflea sp. TYP-13 TaxID=3230023 RepID=UPI0034C6DC51
MTSIPMSDYYFRQYELDGVDFPAGRKGRILSAICHGDNPTRKKIATDMALRPATVSDLVLELIRDGLVIESRPTQALQKGRPEILLSPASNRLCAVVFHAVSHTIHCAVVDFSGRIHFEAKEQVHADRIDKHGFTDVIERLSAQSRPHIPKAAEHCGFALSLPGIVDEPGKRWVYSAYWPKLPDFDLNILSDILRSQVIVRKNLNCELRARISRHARIRNKKTLLIHWGIGIGAAFASNGKELDFGDGFGEIGHCVLDPESTAHCKCGMIGCMEAEAGLWALATQSENQPIPIDEHKFEEFLKMCSDKSFLKRPILLMAHTLRNLTLTLMPDEIVLTGPFVQSPDTFQLLLDEFEQILPERSLVSKGRRPAVVSSRRSKSDEIIGAASDLFRPAIGLLCGNKSNQPHES